MKQKMIFAVVAVLLSINIAVSQKNEALEIASLAISTAEQLAAYGYKHKDPYSLISAAQIVLMYPELKSEEGGTPAKKEGENSPAVILLDVPTLINDAKKMAGEDAVAQTLAIDVLKSYETASRAKGSVMQISGRIFDTAVYRLTFEGGAEAQIAVMSGATTDLDLSVLDNQGVEVASDKRKGKESFIRWTPNFTSTYQVIIKNTGDKTNTFILIAN